MEIVKVSPFRPELAPYFLSINQEWIEQFFCMEPFDIAQLKNPQENIINKGGEVLFASYQGEIVGTVGMKKMDGEQFELIKMGVLPKAHGKNIGFLLGQAAIEWAKSQGAKKVVLYSNSVLAPAIALYKKMGFQEVVMEPGTYQRCDVKMEYVL